MHVCGPYKILSFFLENDYWFCVLHCYIIYIVSIATQQPDVWYRHIPANTIYAGTSGIYRQIPAYTIYAGTYQMRCTAYKVAPDDGLI